MRRMVNRCARCLFQFAADFMKAFKQNTANGTANERRIGRHRELRFHPPQPGDDVGLACGNIGTECIACALCLGQTCIERRKTGALR